MVYAGDVVLADCKLDAPDSGGEQDTDDDEVGEVLEEYHKVDGYSIEIVGIGHDELLDLYAIFFNVFR